MLLSYSLILLADILLTLASVCTKKYQQWRGVSAKAAYFSIVVSALFAVILFLAINKFRLHITLFSFIMCFAMNSFVIAYTLISRFVIKYGTLAIYSLFLMAGGMVVPYVWGLLFLEEDFSILRTIGLVSIIVAVIICNDIKQKVNFKFILLCFCIFILNGFTSVTSKVHQIEKNYQTIGTTDFIIIGSILRIVVMGLLFIKEYKKPDSEFDNSKISTFKVILLLLITTILSNSASFLLLQGAKDVPATVLYPLNTGGTIIFTAVSGVLIYKEKLTTNLIASIALCFVGTLMFI